MNTDIKTFRRFVLALISFLFFGLAASSLAQGKVKVVKTQYRVELTGIHVHDWHEQSSDYGQSNRAWTQEKGTIIHGFHTKGRGVLFRGMEFKGKLPPQLRGIPMQLTPVGRPVAKANSRQKITIKRNRLPDCGGELGECTGNEPRGVKTTSKQCSNPNARRPFSFEYDKKKPLKLTFPFEAGDYDFCGRKYPYYSSISELPRGLRVYGGIERIAGMKRGERETMKFSREIGEVVPPDSYDVKVVKKCPSMSGPGIKRCWTTDLTYEIVRLK